MSLYAVMTSDLRVMRVMNTEKGAKKYATTRGHPLVGLMDSPSSVSSLFRKGSIWGGLTRQDGCPVTRYGWIREAIKGGVVRVKVVRGSRKIASYFKDGGM